MDNAAGHIPSRGAGKHWYLQNSNVASGRKAVLGRQRRNLHCEFVSYLHLGLLLKLAMPNILFLARRESYFVCIGS